MDYTLGFIGCGNMGGALVTAAAKSVDSAKIAVADSHFEKIQKYERELGVIGSDGRTIAQNSRFVVMGVKPQAMERAIAGIKTELLARADVVIVTMAAGLSIAAIRSYIGADLPVIRIMPNTPVALGEGIIVYSTAGVDEQSEQEFLSAFKKAGKFDKIPEEKLDGASALSGCGPAFVYAFAEALADGGVECGVPREKAALYTAQTLLGAAAMLLEYGQPGALKDAVCSPGGTTIAGMHALERGGMRGAVMDAVTAAYERTLELKK
jgi:pyrroline-5-carboxylate reductase